MFWAIRQLLTPFNYLRIRHGDALLRSKAVYDFVLPGILTVGTVGLLRWLLMPLEISKHASLVASLGQLFGLLIAFYMAALAAVATFGRDVIDTRMKGSDATLKVRHHDGGHWVVRPLTYRQFICYLFGYLSIMSLLTLIYMTFLQKVWPLLVKRAEEYIVWDKIANIMTPILFILLIFAVWQIFITSALGIYFMSDRMQTINEPES